MGWWFQQGRGTKDEIARENGIGTEWQNGEGDTFSATDLRLTGYRSAWWIVRKNGDPIVIGHAMLDRRPQAGEWGYKPMDETFGPVNVDCPLALLALVPDPGGYATEWRERVRAYHAERSTAHTRGLKVGDRIKLKDVIAPISWGRVHTVKGQRVLATFGTTSYRVPRRKIAEIERA